MYLLVYVRHLQAASDLTQIVNRAKREILQLALQVNVPMRTMSSVAL
jgi:hypothetical protein